MDSLDTWDMAADSTRPDEESVPKVLCWAFPAWIDWLLGPWPER
jgi:hypothetical protein